MGSLSSCAGEGWGEEAIFALRPIVHRKRRFDSPLKRGREPSQNENPNGIPEQSPGNRATIPKGFRLKGYVPGRWVAGSPWHIGYKGACHGKKLVK
jgi:hypothetical protein